VWEVDLSGQSETLIPVDQAWGAAPKHAWLTPKKVFVFDFGHEAYVWNGRDASADARRAGANLLKKVWAEEERPEWGVAGRFGQNMETSLFKWKFSDWPEEATGGKKKAAKIREDVKRMMQALDACTGEMEVMLRARMGRCETFSP